MSLCTPHSRLSIGQKTRPLDCIRMPRHWDRCTERTSLYRSACEADEALNCRLRSCTHHCRTKTIRACRSVALAPPSGAFDEFRVEIVRCRINTSCEPSDHTAHQSRTHRLIDTPKGLSSQRQTYATQRVTVVSAFLLPANFLRANATSASLDPHISMHSIQATID